VVTIFAPPPPLRSSAEKLKYCDNLMCLQQMHPFKPNLLLPLLKVVERIYFGSFLYSLCYLLEYHIRLLRIPHDALDYKFNPFAATYKYT